MSKKDNQINLLRAQAEAKLVSKETGSGPTRPSEELLHELQVHQIELEMQNDELRRTQLALEETHDRYVDLYEFAPVGYLTLSHEAHITAINLTGAALLGEERQRLLRRSFSRIVAAESQDSWLRYFKHAIQHNDQQICELTLVRKDGTRLDVRLDSLLILTDAAGPVLRIALTDITERKHLDRMLRDKHFELANARFAADKANRAKSEFLSSMSHELRSPLNAILGFAQLLESGPPQPTPIQKSRIEQIVQAGWYLLDLINEILDLALIESGKLSLKLEAVSLPDVLLDCQTMIEPQATKNGIHLSFPKFDGPCLVHADRTRLKQVCINLLSNAIKYNRAHGSVEVTYHTRTANRIHISVRDTGEGLSSEKILHLFQPFNRLGQESGKEEGTGIGLVVCKRLMELMGGEIGVESHVGTGSIFWVELALPPLSAPPDTQVPSAPARAAAQAHVQNELARRSVLYVEDNPANMLLVEQIFGRRPDLHLLQAGDGTSGIAIARLHQPEVILMDIDLPGISGIQALKLLREDLTTAHIPVLAISANAMPVDIKRGLEAGFFCYITKPIKVDEFLNALDEALKLTHTISANSTATGGIS